MDETVLVFAVDLIWKDMFSWWFQALDLLLPRTQKVDRKKTIRITKRKKRKKKENENEHKAVIEYLFEKQNSILPVGLLS